MKTALLSIFLLSTLAYGHHHHEHHDDHIGFYWEDYTENSLVHAVKGGKDSDGKITYIGRAKHTVDDKEVLIPGVIYPDSKCMVYELDKSPHKVHEHFKILCSNYPDHMEWLPTNTEEVKDLVHEKELIEGGVDESGHKIYIGRFHTDDELLVGKVLITEDDDAGCYSTGHSGYVHKTSFEVLAHVMKH